MNLIAFYRRITLIKAVKLILLKIAEILLAYLNININLIDSFKCTSLIIAAIYKRKDVILLLLYYFKINLSLKD